MHPLLADEPGGKRLLLGNEAIVRGALEAGVGFVSTYPGTPSSEIGDNFYRLSVEAGINFEYSVNEKVALEVAAAAAISGVRTLCAMKHVGLNVAADPLMTLAYVGVRAGLVIVSADDPGCHSSQNEQDNRYYSLLAQLPMFDPATPAECFEMVKAAFDLSERHELPVILRTTTRVAHARGIVTLQKKTDPVVQGEFIPDPFRFMPVPAVARKRHPVLRKQNEEIARELEGSKLNYVFGSGRVGIIASGAGSTYAEDILRENKLTKRVRFLKIGVAHPLDNNRVADFLKKISRVLMVEELEPFLENQIKAIAHDEKIEVRIFGKSSGHFSPMGEFTPDIVADALFSLLKIKTKHKRSKKLPSLPPRPPAICPGCPHRATYYLAKMAAGKGAVFASDIGCYTLGFLPPIQVGDMFICMGSSASSSGGLAAATGKNVIGFIGDSTFFHSGLNGLANTLRHNRNVKLIVMDNSTTGMTGHQPHPGSKTPGLNKPVLSIEQIAKGMGVPEVIVVDPKNLGKSLLEIERVLALDGPAMIISRSPCPIYDRKILKTLRKPVRYEIDHDLCKHCGREQSCLICDTKPDPLVGLFRSKQGIESGPATVAEFFSNQPQKMQNPPCEAACPARICVPGYISRIAAGDLPGAIRMIRQRVALPNALCRICDRPCESACIRGDYDDPVSINQLKRFAMDSESDEDRIAYTGQVLSAIREKNLKVAVIGAGPAGLQCAHDLRQRGYDVTVFEAESRAGGLARWGIPDYRLPKDTLEKDLRVLERLGVRFEFNVRFGRDIDTEILKLRGFKAGFLGVGQKNPAALRIPGEELPDVTDALSFLRRANTEKVRLNGKVIVIGGGNAAIDAARAAIRSGAAGVLILYRRTQRQMPADPEEIQAALSEGIRIETQTSPISFEKAGSKTRIACQKMELAGLDTNGRPRPVPIKGKTHARLAHQVIVAIGQAAESKIAKAAKVGCDKFGRMKIDPKSGATSNHFWFAGGDVVTGPASFVEALESGKIAAYGIDLELSKNTGRIMPELPGDSEKLLKEKRYNPGNVIPSSKTEPEHLRPSAALKNFKEVEHTYSAVEARKEAERCLACGNCGSCNNCIDNFGCTAFYKEDGKIYINPILCDGCGTCIQICPNGAIGIAKE